MGSRAVPLQRFAGFARSRHGQWQLPSWATAARRNALFIDALRLYIPVRIGAETAVLAGEHLSRLLVAFERPQQPVRRHVGELAAAGMKVRRTVASVVARAIERRHVIDRFK